MSAHVRLWIIVATLLWGVGITLAQDPAQLQVGPQTVSDPLPEIVFPDWRTIASDEETQEYEVNLPSAYVTAVPANNLVPLRILMPASREGSIPVVLILHYWGARDLRAERSLAAELNQRGIAAAIMSLPYHLSRTPPGQRSGDMAVEPDASRLRAVMLQATMDVRRSISFLQSRTEFRRDQIGVMGTSLGAVVAALVYAVDDRVSDICFLVGGIDLANILWQSSRLVPQRDALRRRGYTLDKLREELAPVEPMTYLPRPSGGTAFVIAAKHDTVIPQASTNALVNRLTNPQILSLDTGHYGGVFVQRRILREVARFFEAEFTGEGYVAPARLVAPTIRIGVKYDAVLGPDLGAAIDLVRFDPAGKTFLTAFATPRDIQIVLAHKVWQGFSISASGSTKGIGVGLFWSSVL